MLQAIRHIFSQCAAALGRLYGGLIIVNEREKKAL
jgi:hypothetical protein